MTNKQVRKVAFITGASRGIGAESAVALAKAGWDVAITARTLNEGEAQNYAVGQRALPGSLAATAQAVNEVGGEALCLKADILDQASVVAAAEQAIAHYGQINLLFNNAVYQGEGNQQNLLEVTDQQLKNIYQSNIFTPLALVKTLLPNMLSLSSSTVINMVSFTAFNDPPAPASEGGWGFAYPSSKAAFGRRPSYTRGILYVSVKYFINPVKALIFFSFQVEGSAAYPTTSIPIELLPYTLPSPVFPACQEISVSATILYISPWGPTR